MEKPDRTQNRARSGQGGERSRSKEDRGRQDEAGKGAARPTPSGVPNEGRGMVEGRGGALNPDEGVEVDERGDGPVDETDDGPQEMIIGQNRNR